MKPSIQGRMYCKLHDSSKHNFEDCNMFCQIVKSAIDKGRLKFVETPTDDQSIPIGPDGKNFLHRLLQADPFKEKVKIAGDEIKISSKEVVQEHNENILEGMSSIEVTVKTPRTGGQHANPMINESEPKENKGRNRASVRDQKSPSLNYWININRRVKRILIGRIMQRNQDHPQGANMRIDIGKARIFMQHIHILILGRQCQCRGCLPILM